MPNDQFTEIWNQALSNYQQVTGVNLSGPGTVHPQNVDELMSFLDADRTAFEVYRKKKAVLWKVLSSAMKPVELLGDIAGGGASVVFAPSQQILGAFMILIKAAKSVSSAYESLLDLFGQISSIMDRLQVHLRQFVSPEMQQIFAEILVCVLEISSISTKLIQDGRAIRFLKNVFSGDEGVLCASLTKLQTLVDKEVAMVGALNLAATNLVLTGTTQSGEMINNMSSQLEALVKTVDNIASTVNVERDEVNLAKLRQSLQPVMSVEEDLANMILKSVVGTGNWITDEPLLQSWIERDFPIMRISGGPGAGKSFISAFVIEHLLRKFPQRVQNASRTSVAYFFCRDRDPTRTSFGNILKTMAYQTAMNDPVYAGHVSSTDPEDVQSAIGAWRKLFISFFKKGLKNVVYLVIDGLDEANRDELEHFLTLLLDVRRESLNLQILLVGRPDVEWYVDQVFFNNSVPVIEVTARKNDKDIREYIKHMLSISRLKRLPKGLQTEITESLSVKADGMFLWIDFMLKDMSVQNREDRIRKCLDNLPRGLPDTYRFMLERFSEMLDEEDVLDLNEILMWVTFSKRPLSLAELNDVLKLRTGEGVIDLEGDLRKRYASFFTVIRPNGMSAEDYQDLVHEDDRDTVLSLLEMCQTEVRLRHASIGDFFRAQKEKLTAVGLTVAATNKHLAMTCLRVVTSPDLVPTETDMFLVAVGERNENLYPYAADSWYKHLADIQPKDVSIEDRVIVVAGMCNLLTKTALLRSWLRYQNFFGFYTLTNIDYLFDWICDSEVMSNCTSEVKDWILKIGENREALIRPMVMTLYLEMMEDTLLDQSFCFYRIHAHLRKFHTDIPLTLCENESNFQKMPASEIMAVIDWAKMDSNSLYLTRAGRLLRVTNNSVAAKMMYQKALQLDDKNAMAYFGLALAHGQLRENSQAVETMERYTVATLKGRDFHQLPKFDSRNQLGLPTYAMSKQLLSQWKKELGDVEGSRILLLEAINANPNNELLTTVLLQFAAQDWYTDIISVLQQLENIKAEEKPYSRLVEYVIELAPTMQFGLACEAMYRAGLMTQKVNLIKELCMSAIEMTKMYGPPGVSSMFLLSLGRLYAAEFDEDRAIELWTDILNDTKTSKTYPAHFEATKQVPDFLGSIYLTRAMEPDTEPAKRQAAVIGLESLAGKTDSNTFAARTLTSGLGLYYRSVGREADAKLCFKQLVDLAVDILSDDISENDLNGYFILMQCFANAGDEKNMRMAYYRLILCLADDYAQRCARDEVKDKNRLEDSVVKSGVQEREPRSMWPVEEVPSTIYRFICAYCIKPVGWPGVPFYVCRFSMNHTFCQDCIKIIQAGQQQLNVCHKTHSWYLLNPLEFPTPTAQIKNNGPDLKIWLNEIKAQYI